MSKDNFFHLAKRFFYGTFASRILGMVRDIAMAFYFGSSPEIASFMVAYRLSNLFRRLFGEGTINAGFVPHFEALNHSSNKKSYEFYRDLLFSLVVLLLILTAIIELVLALNIFSSFDSTLLYIMIMLPGLIFICLYALNSAFLNCHRRFFLPAIAPIFFNIVWIVTIILVQGHSLKKQMTLLSFSIVVAYFSQFLTTHFSAHKIYYQNIGKEKWHFPNFFSKHVKLMLRPLTYSIIGVGALQINSAIDAIYAKIADPSGPAYLWYAIRLQQLPFALFSVALSSALLPTLSKALQKGQSDTFSKNLQKAISLSFALMLVCTVGIFVIGGYAVNLIYGRGDFTGESISNTYQCLVGYSIGLIPQTVVLIIANCFYAKKKYKVPAFATIATVVINILLNGFFVFGLKMNAFSVALATSISACFNAAVLGALLKKNYKIMFFPKSFVKVISIVAFSSFVTHIFGKYVFDDPSFYILLENSDYAYPSYFFQQVIQFFSMSFIFLGSITGFFLITAFLTKKSFSSLF